ncbi:MAG: indolepyruvate oxidoreductase subunit beta [Oscillospiraceae bacterium]|nr:indolepyruvate oxidoreductase subunit beta [Oscillospiraceae bacterium]
MQKKSVLIVGVGGQGTILTAKILVNGLIREGYDVKMSEVHGMSQRGGSVSTQVHFGEKVWSPVTGKGAADVLLAFEKMEAVRYANMLRPDGIAIINDFAMPSATIAAGLEEYPEGCVEAMQASFRTCVVDAAAIARDLGDSRCMNVVLFGAMTKVLELDEIDWEQVIRETVPPKTAERNCEAFRAGRDAV